jgi:hypothetical protein
MKWAVRMSQMQLQKDAVNLSSLTGRQRWLADRRIGAKHRSSERPPLSATESAIRTLGILCPGSAFVPNHRNGGPDAWHNKDFTLTSANTRPGLASRQGELISGQEISPVVSISPPRFDYLM